MDIYGKIMAVVFAPFGLLFFGPLFLAGLEERCTGYEIKYNDLDILPSRLGFNGLNEIIRTGKLKHTAIKNNKTVVECVTNLRTLIPQLIKYSLAFPLVLLSFIVEMLFDFDLYSILFDPMTMG